MTQSILIVDDEKEFASLVAQALGMRGYQTTQANSGPAALEALTQSKFDLMTLDLNMPGMHGLEVAKIVNEKYPDLKIVIITGFGSDFDDEIPNYKIDKVLPKPIPFADLISAVREVLG